jgi:NADH-quinone oxidoreductase subunit E
MEPVSGKAKHIPQPASFEFSDEHMVRAKQVIARYPEGRQQSAVMPLLTMAQNQCGGWLPKVAMDYVAHLLDMPQIKVYEVATFYSMYNLEPIGRHHIQVCTTTPCWLRGSDEIVKVCKNKLGINFGQTTEDGKFTMTEVECLGACANAPMIEVTSYDPYDDVYYEDLTAESVEQVLDALAKDERPDEGSVKGRRSSEPLEGPTSLANQRKVWEKEKKKA